MPVAVFNCTSGDVANSGFILTLTGDKETGDTTCRLTVGDKSIDFDEDVLIGLFLLCDQTLELRKLFPDGEAEVKSMNGGSVQ